MIDFIANLPLPTWLEAPLIVAMVVVALTVDSLVEVLL